MILSGVILILMALIIAVADVVDDDRNGMGILIFIFTLVGVIFAIAGVTKKNESNNPQAIDVYRGNTTLQITYKDSIPVDTVVVFKNR